MWIAFVWVACFRIQEKKHQFRRDVLFLMSYGSFSWNFYWALVVNIRHFFIYRIFRRCRSGSGSRRAIWTTNRKSEEISCFEMLDVLFWGLKASPVAWTSFMEAYRISKLQFLIKKIFFPSCNFFLNFDPIKTLDPDPDPDQNTKWHKMMDPDLQNWNLAWNYLDQDDTKQTKRI